MANNLDSYQKRRDFGRTPEPEGSTTARTKAGLYVMHKHAASHDHYDLRLEHNGVLRSWALPKGPSLEPGEKRLAVEVEDHPLGYGDFEGTIPADQYGGGTVMIWDLGHWQPTGKMQRNQIDFKLRGHKLSGHWTLVRMHGRVSDRGKKGKNWLLIRRRDPSNKPLRTHDRSVVTGRTMDEIARERPPSKNHSASSAISFLSADALALATEADLPRVPAPQLATKTPAPPSGDGWLHEIKFDGYRLLAILDKGRLKLLTRNGKDWSEKTPAIADALRALPVQNAVIDGELVFMRRNGVPSFTGLQNALGGDAPKTASDALVYQAFDVLHLDGFDVRAVPLTQRKAALAEVLSTPFDGDRRVCYCDHVEGDGDAFYAQIRELGLEGMVSKQARSSYRAGRQRTWLKVKRSRREEFVVAGYTEPSGARTGFGSLLLGAYQGTELMYAGRVGAGFDARQRERWRRRLSRLETRTSPFCEPVPDTAGVHWVRPRWVVEVDYAERTDAGLLRQPVYLGERLDKSPLDVVVDPPQAPPAASALSPASRAEASVGGVRVTHPRRRVYPERGITKFDVVRYYQAVAEWMLPRLRHRPLVLVRCPEGGREEGFLQKHPEPNFAPGVPRIEITEDGETRPFVYVRTVVQLIELAQFNAVEFHPWGARVTDVERPDTLVFDLDPAPDVGWTRLREAALRIKDNLERLAMAGFVQASGGKGLHVLVPIEPRAPWRRLRQWAEAFAKLQARERPDLFTASPAKANRRGRVFIDYLRNLRGNTAVAPYSLRARSGAPVATPLRWDELKTTDLTGHYRWDTVRQRLAALGGDPWRGFDAAASTVPETLLRKANRDSDHD